VCGCQNFFCNCCGLSYCNFGVVGFSFCDCHNLGLVVRIFFLALVVVWAVANLVLLIFFFLIFNFFALVAFWFGLLLLWCCWEALLDHPIAVTVVMSLLCPFFFVVIMSGENSIVHLTGKNYAS